ncbi:MAG TPA: amidohydrolase family protein [Methylomirabilota bacterium]|nr:amidohydrolase family protein [Methylomirabilota bacterium]
MRIDVHTHVVPERWEDWAARYGGGNWPRLEHRDGCRATIFTGAQFFRDIDDRSWNPARRLEDMDRVGIDVQALSPPPVMFCYWADAKATQEFARLQNASVAEIVARHERRFVGMATVPLQDPELAIAELRHARERLGLRAVEIGTCPGGRDFDDPALFDFFAACAELEVAVLVHPAAPLVGLDRMRKYYFPLIVGNPLETALAISTLIFGGVLERLPRLRICFAHGGGAFPFTLARLNHGWRVRPEGPAAIPREPREYARRIFVDSLTLGAANLRFIVGELGLDRVVIGSDYPFDMGCDDPVAFVTDAGVGAAASAAILDGANAARFLGLPTA